MSFSCASEPRCQTQVEAARLRLVAGEAGAGWYCASQSEKSEANAVSIVVAAGVVREQRAERLGRRCRGRRRGFWRLHLAAAAVAALPARRIPGSARHSTKPSSAAPATAPREREPSAIQGASTGRP